MKKKIYLFYWMGGWERIFSQYMLVEDLKRLTSNLIIHIIESDNSLVKMKHSIGKCVCLFIFTESDSCTSSSTLWDGMHQAIYDDI